MSHQTYDAADDLAVEEIARGPIPASGVIVEQGRGALPFALIHGESLVATAAWAAGEAGVELMDASLGWEVVAEREEPLLLHDPLCPMTPPDFLASCVRRAVEDDVVVVGTRPVTDTVKEVVDGRLGDTVDRDAMVVVCSPIVLPPTTLAGVVAASGEEAGEPWPDSDFVTIVGWLLDHDHPVAFAPAPASARRVGGGDDVTVLEAQTRPNR